MTLPAVSHCPPGLHSNCSFANHVLITTHLIAAAHARAGPVSRGEGRTRKHRLCCRPYGKDQGITGNSQPRLALPRHRELLASGRGRLPPLGELQGTQSPYRDTSVCLWQSWVLLSLAVLNRKMVKCWQ